MVFEIASAASFYTFILANSRSHMFIPLMTDEDRHLRTPMAYSWGNLSFLYVVVMVSVVLFDSEL